jgi:orotidine-5'-phosphate decarboxylase
LPVIYPKDPHDLYRTTRAAWQKNNSLLCVGLDPDPAKFPAHLKGRDDAIFEFCAAIVDATADLVCAFKPQIAYFAARRAEDQLEALIAHIHEKHPGIPVILDAKRGDIGSTAEQYAVEAFERYGPMPSPSTLHGPRLGRALPGLPGQGRHPALPHLQPGRLGPAVPRCGGEKLYERVARLAASEWNTTGQIGLVVGATFPAEIARVRAIVGDMPLLVPGIGAQGGDIEATVKAGRTENATGLMINSSRAILYAGKDEDLPRCPPGGTGNPRRHQSVPLRKPPCAWTTTAKATTSKTAAAAAAGWPAPGRRPSAGQHRHRPGRQLLPRHQSADRAATVERWRHARARRPPAAGQRRARSSPRSWPRPKTPGTRPSRPMAGNTRSRSWCSFPA